MKKVMIVFGTRPEAIKMCPLARTLKDNPNFKVTVCVTSQHEEMLKQVLEVFNLVPDYDLHIMKERQTLFDITISILEKIKDVLEAEKPDIVLVHGDTTTTFVTSLACFYLKIPTGHVEAGLRTHNLYSPYPEEFNRVVVDLTASLFFAPTEEAKDNLLSEKIPEKNIVVTGNTAIDALKFTVMKEYSSPITQWAAGHKLILLTAHRRENLGAPMKNIFSAINELTSKHEDLRVVYPLHKNPKIVELAQEMFAQNQQVKLIEPLNVIDFHNLMNHCYLILTDSGGIQEEAPSLKKPVLVLRDTTERPEGIKAGTLKLVGTEKEDIIKNVELLLNDHDEYLRMANSKNPYGDGHACDRISRFLEDF